MARQLRPTNINDEKEEASNSTVVVATSEEERLDTKAFNGKSKEEMSNRISVTKRKIAKSEPKEEIPDRLGAELTARRSGINYVSLGKAIRLTTLPKSFLK